MSNKLLIITSCPENSNGAGTVFLKNIFSQYDYDWVDFNDYITKESWFFQKFSFKKLKYYKNKVEQFKNTFFNKINIENYDKVVITLSNIGLMILSSEFKIKDKLRLIIWDDFRYIANNYRLYKKDFRELNNIFYNAVNSIKCISVMGNNMAKEYGRVNNNYVILRNPVFLQDWKKKDTDVINIIFCGSLYAKEEWNSFINALRGAGFRVNGKRIIVHFVGKYPKTNVISKNNIIYHGFKNGNDLKDIMKEMHIAYLPYWIDTKYEIVSKTSFPTKLSLYLENGLVVFNHSSNYSESTKLIDDYNIGINVHTYNENEIIHKLSILIDNLAILDYELNIKKCIKLELSYDLMMQNIRELLA